MPTEPKQRAGCPIISELCGRGTEKCPLCTPPTATDGISVERMQTSRRNIKEMKMKPWGLNPEAILYRCGAPVQNKLEAIKPFRGHTVNSECGQRSASF